MERVKAQQVENSKLRTKAYIDVEERKRLELDKQQQDEEEKKRLEEKRKNYARLI